MSYPQTNERRPARGASRNALNLDHDKQVTKNPDSVQVNIHWDWSVKRSPTARETARAWPVARLSRLADEAIARGAQIRRIPCVCHAPDVLTMADCRPRAALSARSCSMIRIGGAG
jgi:hypothetical protein